jgi:hypothetical protein
LELSFQVQKQKWKHYPLKRLLGHQDKNKSVTSKNHTVFLYLFQLYSYDGLEWLDYKTQR